jgi:hypothetical protein
MLGEGDSGKVRVKAEGDGKMNMIKIHYKHIWKYHNETLFYS